MTPGRYFFGEALGNPFSMGIQMRKSSKKIYGFFHVPAMFDSITSEYSSWKYPIISQSYPTCCVPVVTWQPQPSPLPSPRSYELEELARRPNQQLARWMTANPPVTDVFKSSGIVPLIP